jgi:hypothetical protein
MVEPAAVGRVVDEIASDEDVTDSAIDDGVEESSTAVDDRVEVTYCDVVSVRGDDTLDRVSAGTDDVAAVVDEVAVTDGELAVEGEVDPTLEVGIGITTVMEDCVAELGLLLSSEPEDVYVGYVEADGYRGIAAVYEGPSHVEGPALLGV